ncbi:hypothetical protein IQ06DRAFT_299836 [Phaeosphaeriaceae sp. SRC1lsM3a]|nr:hypothetical protein IQ06DRAFT_299836 [Stagonospora sp. SRC1lsM3a]
MSITLAWKNNAGWNMSHGALPTATAVTPPAPNHPTLNIIEASAEPEKSLSSDPRTLCMPTGVPLHLYSLATNHTPTLSSPQDAKRNITVYDPRFNETGPLELAGTFLVEYRLDYHGKGWFCYEPRPSSSACAPMTTALTTDDTDHKQNQTELTASVTFNTPTHISLDCASASRINSTSSSPSRTASAHINNTGIIESSMAASTMIVPKKLITILVLMASGLISVS